MKDTFYKLLKISKYLDSKIYIRILYLLIILLLSSIVEIFFLSSISLFFDNLINNYGKNVGSDSFSLFSTIYYKLTLFFNTDNFLINSGYTILLISLFSLCTKIISTRYILFESAYIASFFEKKSSQSLKKLSFEDSKYLNSSDILTYFNHIPNFAHGILETGLNALSSLLILFSIFIYLIVNSGDIIVSPIIFILIFYLSIIKLFSNRLKEISTKAEILSKRRTSLINYFVLMFRNIKLNQNDKNFIKKSSLERIVNPMYRVVAYGGFLSKIPRILVEYFIILLIISFLLINNSDKINYGEVATILFALLRIIPNIQLVYVFITNLSKEKYSINSLYKLLTLVDNKIQDLEFSKNLDYKKRNIDSIIVKNISFNYKEADKNIINNFSANFHIGKSYAIVGKSGTGKSTLLDLILCLLEPKSGGILIKDKQSRFIKNCKSFIQNNALLIGQNDFNCGSYVWEFLEYDKDNFHNKKYYQKLNYGAKKLGIYEFLDKDFLNSFIGENGSKLSGGQLQRLILLKAFISNKRILVFDEVTSALDEKNEKIIVDLFIKTKHSNNIRIFSTHSKLLSESCDEIIFIK